jgi:cell division protein FtsA
MEGAIDLAEEIFHMPVRLGLPQQQVRGLADVIQNPIYSTGVGLLLHARENSQTASRGGRGLPVNVGGMLDRMKSWFQGNF